MRTLLALLSLAVALTAPLRAEEPREPEVYRVGAGDILAVTIHPGGSAGAVESDLTVAGDGTIDVVHAGRIQAAGLSASEIRQAILKGLVASRQYIQPQVSVNVREYLSQGVNVAGSVTTQGRYYLKGPTRLLDVLAMAGGIDDEKAGSVVLVTREGAADPVRIVRRELFGADLDRSRAANIRVQAGDNVTVPAKARFCITGAVNQPGCYTLEEGTTLEQAISLGGGLDLEVADRKNIRIRREGAASDLRLSLDDAGVPGERIEPEDQVVVGKSECLITVTGAVAKPDSYPMMTGMSIVDAIAKAGGTYGQTQWGKLSDVTLIRGGRGQSVNVKSIMSGKQPDVPLECGDKIVVKLRAF